MTIVHTIGHGNRAGAEFVELLRRNGVRRLVDVRAFPASRRHPQFARDALQQALGEAGIEYVWAGESLGGRRRPTADSPNIALRNASFRAYADHMLRPPYQAALEHLIAEAHGQSTAIMCAERLPWRCHRYLIADSLVARGVDVRHIISDDAPRAHALNPIARRAGAALIYDRATQAELGLGTDAPAGDRRPCGRGTKR